MNTGGVSNQVLTTCQQLRLRGYDVEIGTGCCAPDEEDCRDLALAEGFHIHDVGALSNSAGLFGNIRAVYEIYQLLRSLKPTVVHLHMFKARVLGSIAARVAGTQLVVETLHGNVLDGYYGLVVTRVLLFAEQIVGWILAHQILVPDQNQRSELVRRRIAPPRKILVQPVGFNSANFVNLAGYRGRLRGRLGIDPDTFLIGLLARLVPIKGVGDFLEAADCVLTKSGDRKIAFVVAGDGPARNELESRARALNLENHCEFVGRIDEIRDFYADVDVVVISSWSEGTPIGLLEAMACGKPVVATSVGGIPEVIEQAKSGLLVPRRNPTALCDAVLRLMQDAEMRTNLGREARKKVAAQFSVSALGKSTHQLYRELLKELRGKVPRLVS